MKKLDYVDLFVLVIPKKNLAKYKKSAEFFARFVKRAGALDYREFAGDALNNPGMTPFTRFIKVRKGELLIGSYVVYRSRADRDRVNKKMMTDPGMEKTMKEMESNPIFDMKRMLYGGFKTIVRL